MNVYTYTDEDLNRFANQVKESLIAFMSNEGHITLSQEEYEDFCASHAVLIVRPGMFGQLWDKVRGAQKDHYAVTVMHSPLNGTESDTSAPVIQLVKSD